MPKNEADSINAVAEFECPHCKKEIIVRVNMVMPDTSITSREEIVKNKKTLEDRLNNSSVSPEAEKAIRDIIKDENQVIFEDDIEEIFKNI
jgi:hypothetical protein